jgi:hypothetical protein
MAIAWSACLVLGAVLTNFESLEQIGKALLLLSLGYMLFGLGIDRSTPEIADKLVD